MGSEVGNNEPTGKAACALRCFAGCQGSLDPQRTNTGSGGKFRTPCRNGQAHRSFDVQRPELQNPKIGARRRRNVRAGLLLAR